MAMVTNAAGPTASRLLQTLQLYRRPTESFQEYARRYGDTFTVRIATFPAPITFISNPEVIKEIFAADSTDALEAGAFARPVMGRVIGEHALIVIDGEEHRRHRELIVPYFMRRGFSALGNTILDLTDREIASWPAGAHFAMRQKMRSITLQVMLNLLFGEARANSVLSAEVVENFFGGDPSPMVFVPARQRDLGPLTPWRRFVRGRDEIYQGIISEMARRRAASNGAHDDVLSALMNAREERGGGLSEQEILDEMLTMVAAGNDTTATALTWAVYYIFRDAEVLAELRRELATLDDPRDASRIATLPYLDAAVKEVLRIAPIFLFTMRRVKRPTRFGGTDFAADTFVAPCIYLVHHREDLWEEPERFNPARFLNRHHPASHFLPFGGGTRHCIGAALASFEIKLVLSRLLLRADLHIDDGYVPKAKWIGNFIGPSKGVPVAYNPRPSS